MTNKNLAKYFYGCPLIVISSHKVVIFSSSGRQPNFYFLNMNESSCHFTICVNPPVYPNSMAIVLGLLIRTDKPEAMVDQAERGSRNFKLGFILNWVVLLLLVFVWNQWQTLLGFFYFRLQRMFFFGVSKALFFIAKWHVICKCHCLRTSEVRNQTLYVDKISYLFRITWHFYHNGK